MYHNNSILECNLRINEGLTMVYNKTSEVQKRIKQELRLNLVLFDSSAGTFSCSFYYNHENGAQARKLNRLNSAHFPSGFRNGRDVEYLYTDFTARQNADVTLTIDSDHTNPLFMKAYFSYKMLDYFREQYPKFIINKDFINNPEIWVEVSGDDQPDKPLKRFDVYGLNIQVGRYTKSAPELMISYRGTSDVAGKSLVYFQDDLNHITRVVNGAPEVKRYRDVIALGGHNLREYFPVINRELRERHNFDSSYRKVSNKYDQSSRKISHFYTEFIQNEAFRNHTGLNPLGFYKPAPQRVKRVDLKNFNMRFARGGYEKKASSGMLKYGPRQAPAVQDPRILLIVPEGKEHMIRAKLIRPFMEGTGTYYPGAPVLTNMPLRVMDEVITYRSASDPFPEVQEQLQQRELHGVNDIIAFYFSMIPKDAHVSMRRGFYRVKEELLRRGIQMQGFYVDKLERAAAENINWWHQNLCAALLAKMGGIPWTCGKDDADELIIGVGAFHPRWSPHRFVGSSFSFDSSGIFRGFGFHDHENTRLLAGSIKKAVRQYIHEKRGNLRRVFIHYYKDLGREQEEPIREAINSLQPGVPLYLVSINKSDRHDEVVLDKGYKNKMPLSGTYIPLQRNKYLLFNNDRYPDGEKTSSKFPFPLKLAIREIWSEEKREKYFNLPPEERARFQKVPEEVVHEIMEQMVRFSRMYWKSVNPQPLPVTVAYPAMVAEQVALFDRGEIPLMNQNHPFFL